MFSEEFHKKIFSEYGGKAPSDVPEGLVLWDAYATIIAWTDANLLYTYDFSERLWDFSSTCGQFFDKTEEGDIFFSYLPLEFMQ